jgi:ribosomal-protein-alanine N-acetyltransferase
MISTARLTLRKWRFEDIDPLVELHRSPEMMRFLGGPMAREATAAMLERIRAHWDARGFGIWAVDHAGALVGMTGIAVPRWESKLMPCVEILWRLKPSLWGRGLVTEAARAALDEGFEAHGFREVLAFTVPDNVRSWRVMERLGMKRSPEDDFDHPLVPESDPRRLHWVYRIKAP